MQIQARRSHERERFIEVAADTFDAMSVDAKPRACPWRMCPDSAACTAVSPDHRDGIANSFSFAQMRDCGGDVIPHHPRRHDREDMVFDRRVYS